MVLGGHPTRTCERSGDYVWNGVGNRFATGSGYGGVIQHSSPHPPCESAMEIIPSLYVYDPSS